MIDTLVQVPAGWLVAESPPEGIALAAIDPAGDGPLRTNLVVTMVDRPAVNDVDRYLDSVLANLMTPDWSTRGPPTTAAANGPRSASGSWCTIESAPSWWRWCSSTPGSTTPSWS